MTCTAWTFSQSRSVDTEEYIRRLQHVPTTYQRNTLDEADLDELPEPLREVFRLPQGPAGRVLAAVDDSHLTDLDKIMEFAWIHNCETHFRIPRGFLPCVVSNSLDFREYQHSACLGGTFLHSTLVHSTCFKLGTSSQFWGNVQICSR